MEIKICASGGEGGGHTHFEGRVPPDTVEDGDGKYGTKAPHQLQANYPPPRFSRKLIMGEGRPKGGEYTRFEAGYPCARYPADTIP